MTGSPQGGNSALLYVNGTGQLNNTSQGFAVSVSGMTSIDANGYAGDIAQFNTVKGVNTGDNTYYAYADYAAYNNSGAAAEPSAGMYGTGYTNVANGFSTNIGYSNHAGDVAYFYGSPGSDTFYASAEYGSNGAHTAGMLGSYTGGQGTVNYANAASGFATNVGNTPLPNTSDTAYFYGAEGNDTYYAYADLKSGNTVGPSAGMFGSYGGGYSNSATGFAINVGNYAPSVSGNPDRAHTDAQVPSATGTAYFYDSPGNDVYYAYGDYQSGNFSGPSAGMYGSYTGFGAYANLANGFVTNIGESTNGGSDTAYFYDAPGQSTFYANAYVKNSVIPGPSAGMYGSGYANSASGFGTNVAFATPGNGSNDTAYFYDSPGSNTYYAYADFQSGKFNGPSAGMFGSYAASGGTGSISYADLANGFTTSVGNAINGGADAAYFYASPGTGSDSDTYYAYAYAPNGGISGPSAGMYGSYSSTGGVSGTVSYADSANGFTTNVGTAYNAASASAYFYGRRARSAAATRTMPTATTRPMPRAARRCSRRACSAATATPAAAAAAIPRSRMPTRRWASARTSAMRLPIPIPSRTPATRPICTVRPATTR